MITIDFNAFFSYRHVRGLRNNNGMILETKRARIDYVDIHSFIKFKKKITNCLSILLLHQAA